MELHHLGIEETFKILKIFINTISTGHAFYSIHDHNYLLTISSFLFTIDSMQKKIVLDISNCVCIRSYDIINISRISFF